MSQAANKWALIPKEKRSKTENDDDKRREIAKQRKKARSGARIR